jgi:hypothetical protein
MIRTTLIALACAALATPVAQAQDADPLQAFARCVVSGDAGAARDLLAQAPASGKSNNAAKKLSDRKTSCGAGLGKTRADPAAVRGAIAEQLYLTDFTAAPAAPSAPAQPFQGSGDPAQVLYDVSRCAATRDPIAIDALVRTAHGSAEEKAALQPVIAAVGTCTPAGAKVGFNRAQLRAMTAEGLFKVRSAPAPAASGATN